MIYLVFLLHSVFAAQPQCTSADLIKSSCEYLKAHSDKEFLIGTDGGKLKNPYFFQTPTTPDKSVVAMAYGSPSGTASFDESFAEFEMDIDEILETSGAKKLPSRSLSFLRMSSLAMINTSFSELLNQSPNEGGYALKWPIPLDQPKAALKNVTASEAQNLMNEVDPQLFTVLAKRRKNL